MDPLPQVTIDEPQGTIVLTAHAENDVLKKALLYYALFAILTLNLIILMLIVKDNGDNWQSITSLSISSICLILFVIYVKWAIRKTDGHRPSSRRKDRGRWLLPGCSSRQI